MTDECSTCQKQLMLDTVNSTTGAVPAKVCTLWPTPNMDCNIPTRTPAFRVTITNFGSCNVFIYAKTIDDSNWPTASEAIALLNNKGEQVVADDGTSVTGTPFLPITIAKGGTNQTHEFDTGLSSCGTIYKEIGFACIRSKFTICPICDVDIALTLYDGSGLSVDQLFRITPQTNQVGNPISNVTITGNVTCNSGFDSTNISNIFARLLECSCDATVAPTPFGDALVPLKITEDPTIAMYTFTNVSLNCYMVQILCLAPSTSTATLANKRLKSSALAITSSNVLDVSDCFRVDRTSGTINVPDVLVVDCASCIVPTITVTGTLACTATDYTIYTAELFACVNPNPTNLTCSTRTCGNQVLDGVAYTGTWSSTGVFTFSGVKVGCYKLRIICTASKAIIYDGTVCNYLCSTSTNLGSITPTTCTCSVAGSMKAPIQQKAPKVAPVKQIMKAPAQQIMKAPKLASAQQQALTYQLIDTNDQVVATSSTPSFPNAPAGDYKIRVSCQVCSETKNIIELGKTNYPSGVSLPELTLDTSICKSYVISGTVPYTTNKCKVLLIKGTSEYNILSKNDYTTQLVDLIEEDKQLSYSTCVGSGTALMVNLVGFDSNNNFTLLASSNKVHFVDQNLTINLASTIVKKLKDFLMFILPLLTSKKAGAGIKQTVTIDGFLKTLKDKNQFNDLYFGNSDKYFVCFESDVKTNSLFCVDPYYYTWTGKLLPNVLYRNVYVLKSNPFGSFFVQSKNYDVINIYYNMSFAHDKKLIL